MTPWLSFLISILALCVSILTAWLTFFRRGKLMMTQPTTVFFGPDGGSSGDKKNKIYLRTLLYSSAKRGQVVESLHVNVQRGETRQNFNVWVYGDKHDLKRGSGLYVPQEGVTDNHYFLLPEDGSDFRFLAGRYDLIVFAKLVDARVPQSIAKITLMVSEAHAAELLNPKNGLYFDWGADQQVYHPHIRSRELQEDALNQILRLFPQKKTLDGLDG